MRPPHLRQGESHRQQAAQQRKIQKARPRAFAAAQYAKEAVISGSRQ